MPRRLALVLPLLLAACNGEPAPAPVAEAVTPDTAVADAAPAPVPVGDAAQGCAAAAPPPAEGDSLVVLFFGDSLTAGYGLADPDAQAFPARLAARARAAGLPVRAVNAGVSGETSAGGLRRVEWALGGVRPDVFVLALGANDGLRGLDPGAMRANLEGILACVRAAAPEVRLVVAGMEALPNYGPDYTGRFRAVFPAVAERFDAALVPFLLQGVGGVPALNQSDGVHPTAEGQRVIAETIWPVLEPALRAVAASS
jgi:acyl-CoA thioesterase-1